MFLMFEDPSSTYDEKGITSQLEPTLSIDFSSLTSSPLLPLEPTPSTQVESSVFAMTSLVPVPSESMLLQQSSVFTSQPEPTLSIDFSSLTSSPLLPLEPTPSTQVESSVFAMTSLVPVPSESMLLQQSSVFTSQPEPTLSIDFSSLTSSPLLPLEPTPSTQVESSVFAMASLVPVPSESMLLQQSSLFTTMSEILSSFLKDSTSLITTSVTLSAHVSPSFTDIAMSSSHFSVLIHDTIELTGTTALSVSPPLLLTSDSVRSIASFSIDSAFVTAVLPSLTNTVSTYFSSSIDEMSLSLDVMSSKPMSVTTYSTSDGFTPFVMTSSVVERTYTSLPLITATITMKTKFIPSQSRSLHTVERSTYILATSTMVLESSQETDRTSFISTRTASSQSVIQKPSISLYTMLHSISTVRSISTSFVLPLVSSTSFLDSSSLPALSNSFSSTVLPIATPISLPPPVFTVTALNSTAIFLNWSSVADATGYIIFIRENGNSFSKRAALEDIITVN